MPARRLEQRLEHLLGGAGIGGGFEDHQGPGLEVLANGRAGPFDGGEIGPVVDQGGGHADEHDIAVGDLDWVGGEAQPAGGESLSEELVVDTRHHLVATARATSTRSGSRSIPTVDSPARAAAAATDKPT